MVEWFKNKLLWVFLVSLMPVITLLVRGLPWGSDSFAFLAVACGQEQFINSISSPFLFASVLPFFGCNIFLYSLVVWFFYFFALLGLWVFGKRFFVERTWFVSVEDWSWKLPVYVGTLTPLFFVEALRFENDFFSWTIGFIVLGLVCLRGKLPFKALSMFLATILAFISVYLWFPSIFIVCLSVFMLLKDDKKSIYLTIGLILTIFATNTQYFFTSFNYLPIFLNPNTKVVAEEIPLVGLIFIIHIIHFWKYIPKKILPYSLAIIGLGLLKSKYMFLATPLLIIGLIKKEKKEGITIYSKRKKVKETIPVMFFVIILGLGWMVTGTQLAPTTQNLQDMNQAIIIAQDQNMILLNDWDYGWQLEYLGYHTKYKISYPNPDYNNYQKPFVAYTNKKLDCNKISKKIFICES